jgi:hypothetical protein
VGHSGRGATNGRLTCQVGLDSYRCGARWQGPGVVGHDGRVLAPWGTTAASPLCKEATAAATAPPPSLSSLTVCLVGERVERSGADPRFGDGSNPSHVWFEMLGWSGSDPFFCLVGGMRYGGADKFNSVSGSHMS